MSQQQPRPSSFEAFQRATAALHQRRAQERRGAPDPTTVTAALTAATEHDAHDDESRSDPQS
ncbi:MAG: hypothetical protein J0L92_39285 [Deltaproteobacteria bacterium]|nr:hypothetical protein [Deltaproteobacteria bacterium]